MDEYYVWSFYEWRVMLGNIFVMYIHTYIKNMHRTPFFVPGNDEISKCSARWFQSSAMLLNFDLVK